MQVMVSAIKRSGNEPEFSISAPKSWISGAYMIFEHKYIYLSWDICKFLET